MTVLWVAIGAAVGAPLRYLVDRAVRGRLRGGFPWGTFTVNVVASFVLGLVTALAVDPAQAAVLGVGFCGALSTYSTFGYETFALLEGRAVGTAVANLVGSVVAGLSAVTAGYLVGLALPW
ncbi:fluoride efflux transporter CrcB [Pseudonocardia humida]|uniref:Fluoride-specific ion channel FluC n=1 Tax=Pseudonocardia humida TaxID=2800819 RepID=A0ABT0ZV50_9PSEU|nr:fluoride efflux transporter CrcB [Pseudonocardia humida]MCO1654616.1 fluoride efflux transporter CrcB [Pseudonocardia humida]